MRVFMQIIFAILVEACAWHWLGASWLHCAVPWGVALAIPTLQFIVLIAFGAFVTACYNER